MQITRKSSKNRSKVILDKLEGVLCLKGVSSRTWYQCQWSQTLISLWTVVICFPPVKEHCVCLGLYLHSFCKSLLPFLTYKNISSAGRSGIFFYSWQCKSKGLRNGYATACYSCACPGMQGPAQRLNYDDQSVTCNCLDRYWLFTQKY